MAARSKKLEKHRKKRKERLHRQTKSQEQRLRSDCHPVHACLVNRFWEEDGKASIFLARVVGRRRLTLAAFLVDLWAMGLKDAWGRVDISFNEFDEYIASAEEHLGMCPLDLETAKHIVYGGIDLARELGFRLPRRYERWTSVLDPLPAGVSPDRSLFLRDGKILLTCSHRDLRERLEGTTPDRFLQRPDVDFIMEGSDFTLVDPELDDFNDVVTQLEEAFVNKVRQWCFANGQVPHPLLPEVASAMLEATMQTIPEDADLDEEVPSLSSDQEDETFQQMIGFLSVSCHDQDPAEVHKALDQFFGFMKGDGSYQGLLETLDISKTE